MRKDEGEKGGGREKPAHDPRDEYAASCRRCRVALLARCCVALFLDHTMGQVAEPRTRARARASFFVPIYRCTSYLRCYFSYLVMEFRASPYIARPLFGADVRTVESVVRTIPPRASLSENFWNITRQPRERWNNIQLCILYSIYSTLFFLINFKLL